MTPLSTIREMLQGGRSALQAFFADFQYAAAGNKALTVLVAPIFYASRPQLSKSGYRAKQSLGEEDVKMS
jgi:hypothetical protein